MSEDGSQPKKRNWIKIGCLGIVGFFVAMTALGFVLQTADPEGVARRAAEREAAEAQANKAEADSPASIPEAAAEPEPVNDPRITAAEFAAIRPGMTPAQVEAIVGSPGELMSENEMAGIHTFMVQWEGDGGFGANANAMFQDGKLIQKAQFGL